VGEREKLADFSGAETLHLRVERKNKPMTCRSAEKIKLTDFSLRGGFLIHFLACGFRFAGVFLSPAEALSPGLRLGLTYFAR
jgi:hypothetical protein